MSAEADCLFCKIARAEIPTEFVAQGDDWVAFNDLAPQAPHHVLVIPKRHIATLNAAGEGDAPLLGTLVQAATTIAIERGIADDGYRLVMNCNEQGGQSVYHIHLHLLGGRSMQWPPG
jgi:histidine triad (HIT) family protein